MFYGAMKETRDVIPVEQTTADAFQKMIDFFYRVDIDYKNMTVPELFDIVNLAEQYDVPKLMQELIVGLTKVPLAMKNFMEVANIAFKFSQFEDASSALFLHCAKYFHENVTEPREQVKYMVTQHSEGHGMVALKLLSLAESMPPVAGCENCHEKDCLVGMEVEPKKLFRGQHVMANKDCGAYWIKGKDLRFSVINYDSSRSKVTLKPKDPELKDCVVTTPDGGGLKGVGPYAVRRNRNKYGYIDLVGTLVYDCQLN